MDANGDYHKRSKSKTNLAKSLLHRVHSRNDDASCIDEDDPSASPSKTSPSVTASTSTASLANHGQPSALSASSRSQHGSHRSRHRPNLSTSMASTDGGGAAGPSSSTSSNGNTFPTPAGHVVPSLEQSVRLFRTFEALRSGDTAAIQKAMRDKDAADGPPVLHLAIQCAELPVIEFVLSNLSSSSDGVNGINSKDQDGNTPLHVAAKLGRSSIVKLLLEQDGINDAIQNYSGQFPIDVAFSPDIFQQLQLFRSLYVDATIRQIHALCARNDYLALETLLKDQRVRTTIDVNSGELATEPATVESGGTLLHEAARKKDTKLIQILLLNGADPFRRDRKGKLPQDVTKDDRTRAILKRSPAAAEARQGIQEQTIVGNRGAAAPGVSPSEAAAGNKEAREMKGYLKKWTNYTSGWKLRWFVLEEGVLSYYKHQDDTGAACRGAINMRIASLNLDPDDKLKLEIRGKGSVKYHLKANHEVEAKRWYWALNNAIQWTKDEDKEEQRRQKQETDELRRAKLEQLDRMRTADSEVGSMHTKSKGGHSLSPSTAMGVTLTSGQSAGASSINIDEDGAVPSSLDPSVAGAELSRMVSTAQTATIEGDIDDDEEYGDDASSHEAQPQNKDALQITAQSVRWQLEFLAQVSSAIQSECQAYDLIGTNPKLMQAISTYGSAVANLKDLVGKLLQISRDRDAYWQYRLDREINVRRMWEESMARIAKEQEELEQKIGESEDKRRKTKRALKDALDNLAAAGSQPQTPGLQEVMQEKLSLEEAHEMAAAHSPRKKSTFAELVSVVSEDESDEEEEFFDAIGTGEVEVIEQIPTSPPIESEGSNALTEDLRMKKAKEIEPSFHGYEDPVRKRLKMDADDRPKISLWGILKSMIGKDMTKMTLPVSFNEPTSLLQRVAEDMEYTDLLDTAAERPDSLERLVYIAAFAASEYASTIGRVAKPFNPLLGETYEYARPDKGFRFFIEQVSHHPPIGAAWAESPKWDYYGESAVKSKFYGKSFDINPLGTWFLRLRPSSGGEELYTWKKVTSSVIGIITGNPTVDNYGPMEIRNWTTGEVCTLEFKPRGWSKGSAYQVVGKVCGRDGRTVWSIGGKWNDKIYARLTPGYEDTDLRPAPSHGHGGKCMSVSSSQAFLVWEANPRPTGIPFNLTPFVLTLNAIPDNLRPWLAPTDTRLRPDQRAMEEGEYDFAATEKNRLEEAQRARRKIREQKGEEFVPRWFKKARCETTGEVYWKFNGEYWTEREKVGNGEGKWEGLEPIYDHDG
ncbi:uncharacterized protein PV09_03970 [Verruconis gallopava]|uniref:PH domain-containing protein n=1 Tax=Verruconis gallopava TaxID=253628 RepID=A0A0D1YVQ4_9PEZI|nr:uncharacterized protein PV09_03970 [Verruconis gallopava]KIW04782.1 hypothetical protein PV09_03970 [Verruconis gallopava]